MATTPQPLPMFGAYNEHWKNHPARLPISQYKSNTNPNTGAAAVDAAWAAAHPATPATPTTPTTPATPQPTPWNQWYVDFTGTPPSSPGTPSASPATPAAAPLSSQYTPAMMNQVYENPWYILQDVFQGVPQTSPLYQSLRDMGGDPLTFYNTLQGSQGKTGGASDYVDWLADFYRSQGQAGQTNPLNPQSLFGALFGQEKFGSDAPNTLGQILGAGDMSTQIRTLYNMLKDASNVSLNPGVARAYQSALAQAGDQYGLDTIGTPAAETKNISEWIRQFAPWATLGV